MALDPVPWFVGGGAEHSPDVARMVAYGATAGATGVFGNLDFLVTPLPVPGTSVRMGAGAAVIKNGYLPAPDFGRQSYVVRADDVTDLPVPATGSGAGRSDLVVARIDDPQFGGQEPSDPVNGPYSRFALISNVAPGSVTLPEDLGYPAVLLARIDLPPSTGTVQANHIVDLRKIANPRRTRDLYNTQPSTNSTITSATYADFTPEHNRTIPIPGWATQVKVLCHMAGVRGNGSNIWGGTRFHLGSMVSEVAVYDMDVDTRGTLLVSDTLDIPFDLRGTNQLLKLQANKASGTGNLQTDQYTTLIWDVEFLEAPSAD